MPACSSNSESLVSRLNLSMILLIRTGVGLFSLISAGADELFFSFFGLPMPVRRALTLSMSALRNTREQMNQMSSRPTQPATNTTRNMSDLHYLIEQIGAQADSRGQQLLVKLGPDAGGGIATDNAPVRIQSAFLEHEDVLQRDDVAFHAGDFGDIHHPARAVAHT